MSAAQYTVPLLLDITLPFGPGLQMAGDATTSSMRLTGGDHNATTLLTTALTMTHGSKGDFLATCRSLALLG